jgi:cytochrome c
MRSPYPHLLAIGVLAAASACAGRAPATATTVTAAAAPAPSAHARHAPDSADAAAARQLAAGRRVVTSVCAGCHTEQPPPKAAPPLAMVARHYLRATRDSSAAVDRMIAWVRAPSAERSLLPRMAVDRFGLMPPLALPDSTLRAAAAYVLSLGRAHGGAHAMHGSHGAQGTRVP